jgi:anti-anti-sigma factor
MLRPMSTYELELDDTAAAGLVVASLSGELDLTNARELEERLEAAAPEDVLLVVDLNRVVFIDSAALHVLFKLARQRGRERLKLVVEPTAAIVRTLDIVGMKDAVRIVDSLEEASAGRESASA